MCSIKKKKHSVFCVYGDDNVLLPGLITLGSDKMVCVLVDNF